ncbi:Fermitin family 1 [Brachionus plicatilis]|uniref:Fermitin family 1 n=1 Tax=Brachionus plicatilis TaxID=10195 RepID=A0A3M7SHF7_BRAPC|nr:Fermitin family 1 [Brachionus plicatilis]
MLPAKTPGWELRVTVTEFDVVEQSLLVTGETHIGGVIVQLIDKLSSIRNDWSDFALWWPDKSKWLNKNKLTLDQYGVQADALLHFTRIHKYVRVSLPDLQVVDLSVDFSASVFHVTKQVCKELGMRHAEEMSLLKCSNQSRGKVNRKMDEVAKSKETGSISSGTSTLNCSNNSSFTRNKSRDQREKSLSLSGNDSFGHSDVDLVSLSYSPIICAHDYLINNTARYKSIFDKTKVNSRWLDSSKSLMEQNIKENDIVFLKFKYFAFFDLNLKNDVIRINQIYEQAKWTILTEEIDCTEQELINFAASQLQIQLQTRTLNGKSPGELNRFSSHDSTLSKTTFYPNNPLLIEDAEYSKAKENADLVNEEDDIDTALSKLEQSLDIVDSAKVPQEPNRTVQSSNQLQETLLLMKQQKYTFKKFRPFYFILDDNHYLSYFKSKQEASGKPLDKIGLKCCEVVPDVNLSHRRFGITLRVPSPEGVNELFIRCETEQSYANWMSAFKLASKGKPLSDLSYSLEIKSILNLLNMQQTKNFKSSSAHLDTINNSISQINNAKSDPNEVQATNLLPIRIVKKFKLKQVFENILKTF